MGDFFLHLVSYDPNWVPADQNKADAALQFVRHHCSGGYPQSVTTAETENVEVCISGENFQSAHCPRCNYPLYNSHLELTHYNEWNRNIWMTWMNTAKEKNYSDLSVRTPCCGLSTSLADLVYVWFNVGFFRWSITIDNPASPFIPGFIIDEVEKILDQKIKIIRHSI